MKSVYKRRSTRSLRRCFCTQVDLDNSQYKGIWKFKNTSRIYWDNLLTSNNAEEKKQIVDWLGDQLSIKSLDDWSRISLRQIQKCTGIDSWDIVVPLLQTRYPQHRWEHLGKALKANQRELLLAVQQLFPTNSKIRFFPCFEFYFD